MKMNIVGLVLVGLLGACANNSPTVYTTSEAQQMQKVYQGKVIALTPVEIKGEPNPLVTMAGTAVGGVAGSHVGKGNGQIVGAILGGVVSGLITQVANQKLDSQKGVEVVVQLDNAEAVSIVQRNDVTLHIGDRVRVLTGSGKDRVLPIYQ